MFVFSVTITDVNDEPPVLERFPDNCVVVTEFHEPGETVAVLKASDADDPTTPNGWIGFSILAGNEQGNVLFFHYVPSVVYEQLYFK